MRTIRITENSQRTRLPLIAGGLREIFRVSNTAACLTEGERTVLSLEIPEEYEDFVLSEIKEKVAEVIAIGYKYDYFMENTQVWGLSARERELFYTAVIAADLPEDRRYVRRAVSLTEEVSVDGIYHFKLPKLMEKWKEIAGCLPSYFGEELYRNFMQYLIDDFSDSPVYVVGEQVFDKRYGKRGLSLYLGEKQTPNPAQEILLCCGKEIHVVGEETTTALPFLKEFYGKTTHFHRGEGFSV